MKSPAMFLLTILGVLLVLGLISVNLTRFLSPPKKVVLGETINLDEERIFWENLLRAHPNYQPGQERLRQISDSQ